MSIPVIYTDSEKSKYYSTDDYVSMSDYHHSFNAAQQTSLLRMVIAPGSVKYFNKAFTPQAVQGMQTHVYSTQSKLTPIVSNGTDDSGDYMSYSKK